jgi:hypothetical protein
VFQKQLYNIERLFTGLVLTGIVKEKAHFPSSPANVDDYGQELQAQLH